MNANSGMLSGKSCVFPDKQAKKVDLSGFEQGFPDKYAEIISGWTEHNVPSTR